MRATTTLMLLLLCSGAGLSAAADRPQWPQWRGPSATGAADGDPPVEWSETKNIRWKIELPGLGSSTPVVVGNQIVLTAAIDTGKTPQGVEGERDRAGRRPDDVHQWVVLSYDRSDGSELWRTQIAEGVPHEGEHMHSTWASNSSVADGERIYAYFGSRGLHALNLEGEVLWSKDFGTMNKSNAFGEGSSPALWGDRIVIQWDHEGDSFIAALDAASGEERWRKTRDEHSTWSTPVIAEVDGRPQVITNATAHVRAYDLESGDEIWQASGMTDNVIPTPVVADGVAYIMSGFRGYMLLAVELSGAKGDVMGTDKVLWTYDKDTPYVVSPLLYDGTLYFFKVLNPILTAVDAKTGKPHYGPLRMEDMSSVYASPVAAAGRVYISDREGTTTVLKAGSEYEVLATNQLDDGHDASAVIVDDTIYFRGRQFLYAIAE